MKNIKFWNELIACLSCIIYHFISCILNYSKLHTLVSMIISPTIVTVVKQWIQLCDALLHICKMFVKTSVVLPFQFHVNCL
jgi:hypothetical protein